MEPPNIIRPITLFTPISIFFSLRAGEIVQGGSFFWYEEIFYRGRIFWGAIFHEVEFSGKESTRAGSNPGGKLSKNESGERNPGGKQEFSWGRINLHSHFSAYEKSSEFIFSKICL